MATPTNLPGSFTTGDVLTAANMNNIRGAFRILQVVSANYATLVSSSSTTYVDTGLTASITCQATSSKVLVLVQQSIYSDASGQDLNFRLLRSGTAVQTTLGAINTAIGTGVFAYLDSPASVSALTYKTQIARGGGSGTVYSAPNSNPGNIVLMEISA
jgi:hypothetical protein